MPLPTAILYVSCWSELSVMALELAVHRRRALLLCRREYWAMLDTDESGPDELLLNLRVVCRGGDASVMVHQVPSSRMSSASAERVRMTRTKRFYLAAVMALAGIAISGRAQAAPVPEGFLGVPWRPAPTLWRRQ